MFRYIQLGSRVHKRIRLLCVEIDKFSCVRVFKTNRHYFKILKPRIKSIKSYRSQTIKELILDMLHFDYRAQTEVDLCRLPQASYTPRPTRISKFQSDLIGCIFHIYVYLLASVSLTAPVACIKGIFQFYFQSYEHRIQFDCKYTSKKMNQLLFSVTIRTPSIPIYSFLLRQMRWSKHL